MMLLQVKRKSWFIFVIGLCLFFLSSCGNEKEQKQPMSLMESKQYEQNEQKIQMLEGGPEEGQREKAPKPGSNWFLQKQYSDVFMLHGSEDRNEIALTFDDGPDTKFTPQVLDVLKKYNVKATFFLIGARATAHSEVTKRIKEEGHAIGNHTYWHPRMYAVDEGRVDWEITETAKAIEKITGDRPYLFRAPYGGLTDQLIKQISDMEYSIIGWDVDSLDWKQLSGKEIEQNVMKDVHPGAIILMHTAGDWTQDLSGTAEALERLIPKFQQQGVKFVTIPEMLRLNRSDQTEDKR